MANVNAGTLDQRIAFLIPVEGVDAFNAPVQTFETFDEVWAARKDVSTMEALRSREVGAEITARFTVRYSLLTARIDPRFRLRHDGADFDITGVRRVGRAHWIEIDARARAETAEVFETTSP
jgi:SPP1 family predicted phage head-tail adaptor